MNCRKTPIHYPVPIFLLVTIVFCAGCSVHRPIERRMGQRLDNDLAAIIGKVDADAQRLRNKDDDDALLALSRDLDQTAGNLIGLGQYKNALVALSLSLDMKKGLVSSGDPEVAEVYRLLAICLAEMGRYRKAHRYAEKSFRIRSRMDPPDALEMAFGYDGIGYVHWAKSRYDKALPFFQTAYELRAKQLGAGHPQLGESVEKLGALNLKVGQAKEAAGFFERALDMYQRRFPSVEPEKIAQARSNLAIAYFESQQYEKGEEEIRRAYRLMADKASPGHPLITTLMIHYGMVIAEHTEFRKDLTEDQKQGKYTEALRWFEEAEKRIDGGNPPDWLQKAAVLFNRASLRQILGEYDVALAGFEQALDLQEKILGAQHQDVGETQLAIAQCLKDLGKKAAARYHAEKALAIFKKSLPKGHWLIQQAKMLTR